MAWLIRNDPEIAINQALSYDERQLLPADWGDHVEQRFSEYVQLDILPDCSPVQHPKGTRLHIRRGNRETLQGVAWGALLSYKSKKNFPVDGIAIGQWGALAENGIVYVDGREKKAVEAIFPPVAKNDIDGENTVTALVGGGIHRFASQEQAQQWQELYAGVAALPGPDSARPLTAALANDGLASSENIFLAAQTAASSWTETPKSVLVINAVFPDSTTPVGTQAQWQSVMGEVSDWLSDNSYGKTHLQVTVPPNVFALPSPVSVYEPSEDYYQVMSDAKAMALAVGYDSADYDITVVAFPNISSWWWAGRAGGSEHWLNGTRSLGVIAHEFGHNYGLDHASSWDVNDGSILPLANVTDRDDPRHVEYGDRFSAMGSNPYDYPDGDFSPHGKAQLNWIPSSQVETVTAPGTYRIHRFDHASSGVHPKLALKFQRADSLTYWLGYRQNFVSNTYLSNGAYVTWEFTPYRCRLLDMTPDSKSSNYSDKEDAALAIGQTFADPTGFLYITPVAQGGTAPNEWLDVQVEFTIAGNNPPVASITPPPIPIPVRSSVRFMANASDPDGDNLIYVWDFGDGQTASGPQVDWTFLAGGSHTVALRVTDGKGGLIEVSETFTVPDPLTEIEDINFAESGYLQDGIFWRGLHLGANAYDIYGSLDSEDWRKLKDDAVSMEVNRFAASADRVVVVGDRYDSTFSTWVARAAVSVDGLTWTTQTFGNTPRFNSVAYGDGLFVAVGDGGNLFTSPDGLDWTKRTVPVVGNFSDIIHTGTDFILSGYQGTSLTSADGITWTQQTTPATWPSLSQLANKDSHVIAVGLGGSYWWSDDDGANWHSQSFNIAGFSPRFITYGEGVWIAAASQYISSSSTYKLTMAVSTDGINWGKLPVLPMDASTRNIRIHDGRLWVYGAQGIINRSGLIQQGNQPPTLQISWPTTIDVRTTMDLSANSQDDDGDPVTVLWTVNDGEKYLFGNQTNYRPLIGGPVALTAYASDGQGGYAASEKIYQIDDPLLYWENMTPASVGYTSLLSGACGNGTAVFVGGYDSYDSPLAGVASKDSWSERYTRIQSRGLAYGTSGFVAVGNAYDSSTSAWRSAVTLSADGQSWGTRQFLDGTRLYDVASIGNAYIAVGTGGVILRSLDGQSWSSVPSGVTGNLASVSFSGSNGLITGSNTILRSDDSGQTWSNVTSTLGAGISPYRVLSVGSRLFIAGYNQLRIYDPVLQTWEDADLGGAESIGEWGSLTLHNNLFIGVAKRNDSSISRYRQYLLVSEDGLLWASREVLWPDNMKMLLQCGSDLLAGGAGALLVNASATPGLVTSSSSLTLTAVAGDSEPLLNTLAVGNAGPGLLHWTVASNVPWLAVAPGQGVATVVPSYLDIQLLLAPPEGSHVGKLTFRAPGVPDHEVSITLNTFTDDHSRHQAGASALAVGSAQAGNIQSADDSDWFVFDLTAPGSFSIWTEGGLYTVGELHGATGLIKREYWASDKNFKIERTLLPGRYWVRVDGHSSYTGAYSLHSSFVPAGPAFEMKAMKKSSDNSHWEFTVLTSVGYKFYIEESTSLEEGDWVRVGDIVTADSEETVISIPVSDPSPVKEFYRIVMLAP